jgi:hypothetical protein
MDRRESRIHNLRSRVVPCPSLGGAYPVSSDVSPLRAKVGLPFVANDPIPDLIPVPKDASRSSTPV